MDVKRIGRLEFKKEFNGWHSSFEVALVENGDSTFRANNYSQSNLSDATFLDLLITELNEIKRKLEKGDVYSQPPKFKWYEFWKPKKKYL